MRDLGGLGEVGDAAGLIAGVERHAALGGSRNQTFVTARLLHKHGLQYLESVKPEGLELQSFGPRGQVGLMDIANFQNLEPPDKVESVGHTHWDSTSHHLQSTQHRPISLAWCDCPGES